MFNFNNPCNPVCNNERCDTSCSPENFETLQNARKDLVGEIDAIIQYDAHLHCTNDKIAKATWENIRNEELKHVGELLSLLFCLAPYQKALVEDGMTEFHERMKNCCC